MYNWTGFSLAVALANVKKKKKLDIKLFTYNDAKKVETIIKSCTKLPFKSQDNDLIRKFKTHQ